MAKDKLLRTVAASLPTKGTAEVSKVANRLRYVTKPRPDRIKAAYTPSAT